MRRNRSHFLPFPSPSANLIYSHARDFGVNE